MRKALFDVRNLTVEEAICELQFLESTFIREFVVHMHIEENPEDGDLDNYNPFTHKYHDYRDELPY